jgi:hypothetical protein
MYYAIKKFLGRSAAPHCIDAAKVPQSRTLAPAASHGQWLDAFVPRDCLLGQYNASTERNQEFFNGGIMLKRAVLMLLLFTGLSFAQSLDQTHIDYVNPLLSGANCDTATLNAALVSIGTKERTLFLTATDRAKAECTWSITSNITVPANIRLLVPFGIKANIATGITLTVNGCIDAEDANWQIGPGTVVENGVCLNDPANLLGSVWFSFVYDDCLHTTALGTSATIAGCTAFILDTVSPKLNKVVVNEPVNITYNDGDGRYWLILRGPTIAEPSGWTCVANSLYCWKKDTVVTVPPKTLLLMRNDITTGALTAVQDASVRLFNRSVTYTVDSVTSEKSQWIFLPGGSLTYTGHTIIHNGTVTNNTERGIFNSGGTGRLRFGTLTISDPLFFINGGSGTESDPWVSGDNCGGLCEALDAVQTHGNLGASGGVYRFASATPAMIDIPVTSGDGNIVLDFTDSVYQSTTAGTIIKVNKNGVLSDVSTNLNTIHIRGGLFTTQLAGVKQNDAPIIGKAIDATRVRNMTITNMKFLGFQVAVVGNVADTLTIRENFFRRVKHAVLIEDNAMVDIPQDIYIHNNTASINNQPIEDGGNTDLNGSAFVRADNRVVNLHVYHNGIANSTENSWFVKMMTGDATGNSAFLHIIGNALEQFSQGSKLIEVDKFGTTELENVTIERNQLGSPLSNILVPPYANGQPYVDLEYITNNFRFVGNECTNTATTCLRLDTYRQSDVTGTGSVAASGLIANNTMRQVATNNGKPFNITNVLGSQTSLRIGHNAMTPFYDANMGAAAFVYPDTNVHFDTIPSYTANRVAEATMSFSPWENYVEINGTTTITDIAKTWDGHTICMMFETADGGVNRTATLLIEADFRARVPNESILCLRYDGKVDVWKEYGRINEQNLGNMIVAPTATLPGYATLVNVPTGAVDVTAITVNRNGQQVTLQCQGTTGPTFKDGTSLRLNGDFVCNNASATLTLIPNNAIWFEVSRSPSN